MSGRTVMSFPGRCGGTVEVMAVAGSSLPYDWACSAGDAVADHAYASLVFARRDAQAHAEQGAGVAS